MEQTTGETAGLLVEGASRKLMRHVVFVLLCGAGIALSLAQVVRLFKMSMDSALYTYIPGIPFISLYFFYINRKTIFDELKWSWTGIFLAAPGIALSMLASSASGLDENDFLAMVMSGVVLWVLGVFLAVYGGRSFRKALFPLLFLVFVIPIPSLILNAAVEGLRIGSTASAHLIFKLTGVPMHHEGFVFSLPGITVNVAPECSGIRSAVALLITSLLAGDMLLRKGWSRVILPLCVFPITVFKNGLRITTLTILAAYVDPRFITGSWLHRSGGIPFFVVGLVMMAPVLWGLWKMERVQSHRASER